MSAMGAVAADRLCRACSIIGQSAFRRSDTALEGLQLGWKAEWRQLNVHRNFQMHCMRFRTFTETETLPELFRRLPPVALENQEFPQPSDASPSD